ncbi:hypothetical protein [Thalassospira sp. TSL5-1]|uniref:hypothetical protein n=1 Tax=Thalassospira sp. TSL5-1 TaxID=1544451 RepID=UPI00093F4000|nr:hypothetical protein [Thalassospira sp. TSL5-1]OKH88914.1 hypothetical protein LF95_02215 [Thalassospira sp. TSL5-1]
MKGTILENAGWAKLYQAPFVHAVIDDALDPALFAQLKASRPTIAGQMAHAQSKGTHPPPGRTAMDLILKPGDGFWRTELV